MEGAALSGIDAAEALLDDLHDGRIQGPLRVDTRAGRP